MSKQKIVGTLLSVASLSCLVIGGSALIAPDWTAGLVGLALATALGRSEIMTFYGAFYIGMGLFLALAVRTPRHRSSAAVALLLTGAPAAVVRGYTILAFRIDEPMAYVLFAGETAYALLGGVGWRLSRPRRVQK